MKKFKHKKTGDIAELISNSGYKLAQSTVGLIPLEYIENSSDWEEIVENIKNYQILSFSYPKAWDADLATLHDDGLYKRNKSSWRWDLNSLLNVGTSVKSGDIKIHSVKRLNDDEVFTIGDRCKKGIITEFGILELHDESSMLVIEFDDKCCTTDLNSDWCSKLQPLFTTEDDVDVYEGDKYFRVISNWSTQQENTIYFGEYTYKNDGILRFSTKKAAENYIICNKPCLSFNDVWNISNNKSSDNSYVIIDKKKLKELVKSKL